MHSGGGASLMLAAGPRGGLRAYNGMKEADVRMTRAASHLSGDYGALPGLRSGVETCELPRLSDLGSENAPYRCHNGAWLVSES